MRKGTVYTIDGVICRTKKEAERLIKDEQTIVLCVHEATAKIIQVYRVKFKTIYVNNLFIKQTIFIPCLEKKQGKQLFLDWG